MYTSGSIFRLPVLFQTKCCHCNKGFTKKTVSKWESRDFTAAAFCASHNIAYASCDTETALAVSIRRATWLALDEVFETFLSKNNTILGHKYDDKAAMEKGLTEFLLFYNLYRRHGA